MLAGDQQAFAMLIERYESMAQHLAVQFTGNQEVARELVQEASVQAYLSLDHLRDTSRFKSWFYGITLNVCRSYQRGQKLHQVSLEALMEEQSFIEIGFLNSEVDPQEIVVEQELHSLMLQAITLLSPKNRSVILLFYYEQLSLREIATTLGISVVAVKSRLKQARKALRERLLQMYPELRPVSQGRKRRNMHTVTIADVIQQDPYSIAVLVDTNGQRALPLWIGYWEGQAITSMLQNLPTPGPLSFTLMTDLLQAAESILEEVRLETLKDNILYAVIRLRRGKTIKKVEARSSDALALAAQTNSPLSVADDIWNSMSIELTQAQTKPSQQELERILRIMREKRPQELLTGRNIAPYAHNPRNLDGAERTSGWFMTGSHAQNYDYLFDSQVKQNGLGSFSLKAKVSETGGYGAFLQSIKADAYRGKMVRLSASVKTRDVQPRATLMLYAYGPNALLKYTGNAYGPLTGTQDWKSCEAALNVPEECVHLTFGMVLAGTGQVWFNEIQLTTVDSPPPQRDIPGSLNSKLDFTQEGAIKQILSYAQEESQRFQHNYIGTEHLLLGLLHEPESRAVEVLQSLNANAEHIRGTVEAVLVRGDRTPVGTVGLTPRAKKAIELALDDARLLDHNAPGTEHMLLGLIREGEGIAAHLLHSLGVRYKDVMAQLL